VGSYCFAVDRAGHLMLSVYPYPGYFPMSQFQAGLPWLGLYWEQLVAATVMLREEQLFGQQRVRRLDAWRICCFYL
jgi:hypothetical protein